MPPAVPRGEQPAIERPCEQYTRRLTLRSHTASPALLGIAGDATPIGYPLPTRLDSNPGGALSLPVDGLPGDTALRLGHWFGIDPQFWMNLQAQFDLATAEQSAGAAVRELPVAPRSA